MSKHTALALALLAGSMATACSTPADEAAPVATPRVTLSPSDAAIGSPIDITYQFAVAPNAPPFAEDFYVFVHFISAAGELMWTDDHQPPTPTRQWKAGETIEYRRTVFVPKFPYTGEARVHVGLYSPESNVRLPLTGDSDGSRSYRVAAFQMKLQTDNLFVVYKDGWYDPEVADDRTEWTWSKKQGRISFRNPKRDVTVMIQLDMPVAAFTEPQRVEVALGGTVVDTFTVPTGPAVLRRIPLTADRFGSGETVEMSLTVDKTFVPSAVPALRNADSRELGVRVFRVHIEPK
jgi:hypothetical protein